MRYRLLAVAAFGVLMFAGGWYLGHRAPVAAGPAIPALPVQAAPPLQEIIPFPGQGQGPDQGQGQQGQGECEPVILFYFQGRLYRLMPGPQNQQGRPGSPPEYFPLQPYQGPAVPGLPFQLPPGMGPQLPPGAMPQMPQGPGFSPLQPRF